MNSDAGGMSGAENAPMPQERSAVDVRTSRGIGSAGSADSKVRVWAVPMSGTTIRKTPFVSPCTKTRGRLWLVGCHFDISQANIANAVGRLARSALL